MHPKDTRYSEYKHGDQIPVKWLNGKITATVIKDPVIDMSFGTGVMTITPWHDSLDFDLAERHQLDKEPIIDFDGKLLPIAGEFAGMHIKKARPLIVEKLKKLELLEKIEEHYTHRIATNSRGGGTIEPQIKEQWFIAVNKEFTFDGKHIKGISSGDTVTLKTLMRKVVENGKIKILPEQFEKIYFHWIDNLRDWCISRQIWYGHRIPVWYRSTDAHGKSNGIEPPEDNGWTQDSDTLDTWFSSGLWTFSTLGWPEKTSDLSTYHPTNILETGYDILFFWVARMILMTTYHMGDVPFHTVYLHGLVRDENRQKMSKSKGNVLDPLTLIDKYGTDALRMGLVVGNTPGMDLALSEDKIKGYKHFANKIWNASRFVLSNLEDFNPEKQPTLLKEDEELLAELDQLTADVTKNMEEFKFYLAAEQLYHYFWHTFADKIIEAAKPRLTSSDMADKAAAEWVLYKILTTSLTLLHPFMPFITEEIWANLPDRQTSLPKSTNKLLIIQPWP
jgi:valyl-tRNA synthetase